MPSAANQVLEGQEFSEFAVLPAYLSPDLTHHLHSVDASAGEKVIATVENVEDSSHRIAEPDFLLQAAGILAILDVLASSSAEPWCSGTVPLEVCSAAVGLSSSASSAVAPFQDRQALQRCEAASCPASGPSVVEIQDEERWVEATTRVHPRVSQQRCYEVRQCSSASAFLRG